MTTTPPTDKREALEDKIEIAYVRGVEGNSLYVNDMRVFGPKPWGGGQHINTWHVPKGELMEALGLKEAPQDVLKAVVEVMQEVLRISDRNHEAWVKAKLSLAQLKPFVKENENA